MSQCFQTLRLFENFFPGVVFIDYTSIIFFEEKLKIYSLNRNYHIYCKNYNIRGIILYLDLVLDK